MKTIGLIGGLTWHSTLDYYRFINELTNERMGGLHSAKIILYSVDFAEIKVLTEQEKWQDIAAIVGKVAISLQQVGADFIVIGANTMHNIAEEIQTKISIPLLHIAVATANEIIKLGLQKVALLGTKYTMQMNFYKDKLAEKNIEVVIPDKKDIEYINNSIYAEFGKGIFLPETRTEYLRIIDDLVKQGAEGIIFGCTEIPILIKQQDCSIPVFNTSLIHAKAAVDFALG